MLLLYMIVYIDGQEGVLLISGGGGCRRGGCCSNTYACKTYCTGLATGSSNEVTGTPEVVGEDK
jgi:hypothetical protein